MRASEFFTLMFILGLLGVGVWGAYEWLNGASFPLAASATGPKPAALAEKPGSGMHTADSTRRNRDRNRSAQAAGSDVPLSTVVDVPVTVRFPRRGDLPRGTSRLQVRSVFGEPRVSTSELRDGSLLERYYYFNKDHTEVTVATLENGVVVAAESAPR